MDTAGGGDPPVLPPMSNSANAPPAFLVKTYDMVDDPSTDKIVSWSATNNSFVVWDTPEFSRELLPKNFKHNNFSSFVRQLNTYGFRKVDPNRWEFANEGFLKGQRNLLKGIVRRKPGQGQNQQPPHGQSSSVRAACVEVGKFGLEEEVETLKRDKNVLMQELVKLRQQHQTIDNELQQMVQCLQGMEQRQQQMMSFFAKAVNSPGFLAQFVQLQNESRLITEGNKKRRLRRDGVPVHDSVPPTDGQIVKYQPLTNAFDHKRSASVHTLGVTLQEVPPIPAESHIPPSVSGTIQSLPLGVMSDAVITMTQIADISPLVGSQELPSLCLPPNQPDNISIPKPSQLQEMSLENNIDDPNMVFDIDSFSPDEEMEWDDSLFEEVRKLLDSGDSSREQFMDSTLPKDPLQKNEVKSYQNGGSDVQMQELTEQMGLPSSDKKKF